MTLFKRMISVTAAGVTHDQPRISVVVERQADSTETTGTVDLYNLNPGKSDAIYERATSCVIQAGYPSIIATIFDGQVQRVRRPRQNLAHITHLELGDQTREVDTLGGISSRSYDGPVTVQQLINDFVGDMGLAVGPLDQVPASATITDFVWYGPSGDALTAIGKRFGVTWFEDDGLIRFRKDQPQSDAANVMVSPLTGLVGIPQPTDEGAECLMYLNPAVKIGGIINLESKSISGGFRVVGLRHDAENWAAGPFTTWVDLREL